MSKVTLPDIGSLANQLSARDNINARLDTIEQAFDNTVSRDGTTPNQMTADFDLNGNSLLNVADPVNDTDGVNKRSVGDLVSEFVGQIAETIVEGTARADVFTATSGQTDFSLTESPGTVNNMYVFDSGIAMTPGVDFTLTGTDLKTLTFMVGRTVGSEIVARYVQLSPADSLLRSDLSNSLASRGSSLISYLPAGTGASASTVLTKLREVVSPEDFGCVGDGSTDDTIPMQEALDYVASIGGELRFSRKKTYVTGYCTVSGNTIIDLNNSTWKARATLGAGEQLLSNKNYTGLAVNATSDDHITIRNGEFLTTIATDRTAGLLEFVKCGDLRLENVRITGPKYRGILIYGCKRVWIDRCKVDGYGKTAVTAEGGSAIHVTAHFDGSTSEDVWITRNYIVNGEWSAITITGNRLNVINNHILTVKEAGIFGQPNEGIIRGNIISGVTKKDISASGIELGGTYLTIADNVVRDVNNVCISLTDVTNASVTGNRTINARRDAVTFTTGCHISVLSQTASPNQPRDIKISNNLCIDYTSPATAGIRVEGSGAGGAIINLDVSGNHLQGTSWTTGKGVYINTTYWTAASCSHRDNLGNDDRATGCTATQSVGEALTTSVAKVLTLGAATPNSTGPTGTAMWVVSSPTRITCHEAGRVVVSGQVAFTGAASGIRQVNVLKNGSVAYAGCPKAIYPTAGAGYTQQVNVTSGVLDVAAGDYFELQAMQDTGGALNTVSGLSQTWLSVNYLQ